MNQWRVQRAGGGGLILSPAGLPGAGSSEPWEDANIGPFVLGTATVKEIKLNRVTRKKTEKDTGVPFYRGRITRTWQGLVTVERLRAAGAGRNYVPDRACTWPAEIWQELLGDLQAVADGNQPAARPVQWAPAVWERWFSLYRVGDREVRVPHVPAIPTAEITEGEGGTVTATWRFCRVAQNGDAPGSWAVVSYSADTLPQGRLHLQVDKDPAPFELTRDQWRDVVTADRLPALLVR